MRETTPEGMGGWGLYLLDTYSHRWIGVIPTSR
jgi:hypothetical protein